MPNSPSHVTDVENGIRFCIHRTDTIAIAGWVFLVNSPDEPLSVQLRINGKLISRDNANRPRPWLVDNSLHSTGQCGFVLDPGRIPPPLRLATQQLEVFVTLTNGKEVALTPEPIAIQWPPPCKLKSKIFFMHIAKAGGTSLNDLMTACVGESRSCTHIEARLAGLPEGFPNKFDFVSGHVGVRMASNLKLLNYNWITMMRDPLAHLISHLKWVKYVGSDPESAFHLSHPPVIQQLSRKLANLDFSDPDSLSEFLTMEDRTTRVLFDNCQTRYFTPYEIQGQVSQQDLTAALTQSEAFALIGRVEDPQSFIRKLNEQFLELEECPTLPKSNQSKLSETADTDRDEVLKILEPFIRFDRVLYNKLTSQPT